MDIKAITLKGHSHLITHRAGVGKDPFLYGLPGMEAGTMITATVMATRIQFGRYLSVVLQRMVSSPGTLKRAVPL